MNHWFDWLNFPFRNSLLMSVHLFNQFLCFNDTQFSYFASTSICFPVWSVCQAKKTRKINERTSSGFFFRLFIRLNFSKCVSSSAEHSAKNDFNGRSLIRFCCAMVFLFFDFRLSENKIKITEIALSKTKRKSEIKRDDEMGEKV